MKVSDIMLDLATGDASVHDAYIQEAMGQVKVSAAIYNAAKQIALLDDSERSQIVQEAAEAGLPYDRENSIRLMYGSVDYASELANAVVSKGEIDLKHAGKFLKAKSAKKYTSNLIQGIGLLCNAFCIDTKSLFDDDTIKAIVAAPVSTKPGKDEDGKDDCSVSYITSAIKSGGKYVKDCEIGESDYTGSISKNDLATVITCNFAAAKLAKFAKSKFGENGSKVESMINKAISKKSKSSVSGDIEDLNEKGDGGKSAIVEFNDNLFKLNKNLIEGFNNSIYSLMEAKNNE